MCDEMVAEEMRDNHERRRKTKNTIKATYFGSTAQPPWHLTNHCFYTQYAPVEQVGFSWSKYERASTGFKKCKHSYFPVFWVG